MNRRIQTNNIVTVNVTPWTVTKALATTVVFLLAANLTMLYLKFGKGYEHVRGFVTGFYFDAEANFPSLYSAAAIILAALLLWRVANLESEAQNRFYWKFLSLLFVFLALDEFMSIHEYLIKPMQAIVGNENSTLDYFYFAWLIPYAIASIIVGVILLRFFLRLPLQMKIAFSLSAIIFIAGAVGLEMYGGNYWEEQGWTIDGKNKINSTYALIVTFEELLEMIGIVVFIHFLMRHYVNNTKDRFAVIGLTESKTNRDHLLADFISLSRNSPVHVNGKDGTFKKETVQ